MLFVQMSKFNLGILQLSTASLKDKVGPSLKDPTIEA